MFIDPTPVFKVASHVYVNSLSEKYNDPVIKNATLSVKSNESLGEE